MTRDGILILDAEQAVIEQANPFVSDLLGYSRDELVGRSFRELGIFANRAQGEAIFERVRRDGYVRCDVLPLRVRGNGGVFAEFVGTSYLVDSRNVIAFNVRGVSEFEDAESRPKKARRGFAPASCGSARRSGSRWTRCSRRSRGSNSSPWSTS